MAVGEGCVDAGGKPNADKWRKDSNAARQAWIKTAMYGAGMGVFYFMKEQAKLAQGGRSSE